MEKEPLRRLKDRGAPGLGESDEKMEVAAAAGGERRTWRGQNKKGIKNGRG